MSNGTSKQPAFADAILYFGDTRLSLGRIKEHLDEGTRRFLMRTAIVLHDPDWREKGEYTFSLFGNPRELDLRDIWLGLYTNRGLVAAIHLNILVQLLDLSTYTEEERKSSQMLMDPSVLHQHGIHCQLLEHASAYTGFRGNPPDRLPEIHYERPRRTYVR
jgi:hypothetical protein